MTKILVADDEITMRMLVTETLEIENYETLEAETGKQAVEKLKTEQPEILILDLMMPEMGGYQVLSRLKEEELLADIKIIALTAKGHQSEKEKVIEQGADYFLSKPFSPLELLELIGKIKE